MSLLGSSDSRPGGTDPTGSGGGEWSSADDPANITRSRGQRNPNCLTGHVSATFPFRGMVVAPPLPGRNRQRQMPSTGRTQPLFALLLAAGCGASIGGDGEEPAGPDAGGPRDAGVDPADMDGD